MENIMVRKDQQYTLVVPFQIMLGDKLSNVDRDGFELSLPSGRTIKLRNYGDFCDITTNGFESVQVAEKHFNSVLLYIYWLSLTTNFKVSINKSFQKPYYPKDPEKAYENHFLRKGGRIDAMVFNLEPYAIKTGAKVSMMHGHPVNITLGHGTEKMLKALNELDLGESEALICSDEKLMLALELYNNLTEEKTLASKFLQMNSVVESLLEPKGKPEQILKLIKNFNGQIDEAIQSAKNDHKSIEQLKGFKQGLGNMRKESIRSSLAALTEQAFDILGKSDGDQYGIKCKKAYDVRSHLVHNGSVDQSILSVAYKDLKEVVESILRAKVLHYSKFN
jgi:hypothetical protein